MQQLPGTCGRSLWIRWSTGIDPPQDYREPGWVVNTSPLPTSPPTILTYNAGYLGGSGAAAIVLLETPRQLPW